MYLRSFLSKKSFFFGDVTFYKICISRMNPLEKGLILDSRYTWRRVIQVFFFRFTIQLSAPGRISLFDTMIDESVINNDWCKNDNILVTYDILPTTAISQQFCLTFVDNAARTPPSLRGRQEHSLPNTSYAVFHFCNYPEAAFLCNR